MALTGKKCGFSVLKEVDGNKKEVPVRGEILGEPQMKKTKDNEYLIVPVQEDDGQLHEVAFFRVKVDVTAK